RRLRDVLALRRVGESYPPPRQRQSIGADEAKSCKINRADDPESLFKFKLRRAQGRQCSGGRVCRKIAISLLSTWNSVFTPRLLCIFCWSSDHPLALVRLSKITDKNPTAKEGVCSRVAQSLPLSRAGRQAVMSEVLQHDIQIFLIGRPIVIEVEHTRLAPVTVDSHEILPVHHLVEVAVAGTYRL